MANALHGIDLDAFTLPRPHCLFVCGVFVAHYKDKINKVMWAFAGDALTDAYLEQAALVVDYRQGGGDQGSLWRPIDAGQSRRLSLYGLVLDPDAASLRFEERAAASKPPLKVCKITRM